MERDRDAIVHEIAYAEAVRALSEQHGVIDSFRTRAGLLLSSAAVTTSFLAGQALRAGRVSALSWLALVAFAGVATISVAILWPRRWDLGARSRRLAGFEDDLEERSGVGDLYRSLSAHLNRNYDDNRDALNLLALLFELASVLLAAEVACWIAAIATGP